VARIRPAAEVKGGWRRIWIGASRGGEVWFDSGLGFLDRRRMEDMG
jgi:hypothetical protein